MGADLATRSASCMPDSRDEWESDDAYANQLASRCQVDALGRPNIIIFDWDDTLLCSTAVRQQQWIVEELQDLEVTVKMILRTAMSLGETFIVTNGNATWVQDSARRFLPGLLPMLSQLRVVSARALYEDLYPGDPFMWKHAAFEHLLTKERTFTTGINLIALGDQFPEIDAARHVGEVIGSSLVKTVKFREAPLVSELLGQLSRVEQMMCEIVKDHESQDYGMAMRDMPMFFDDFIASASGWECAKEAECGQGCADPIMGMKSMLGLVE